ncbi:MAG: hypothetical protein AB1521_02000 [Bacteroidota bacterium]
MPDIIAIILGLLLIIFHEQLFRIYLYFTKRSKNKKIILGDDWKYFPIIAGIILILKGIVAIYF